MSILYKKIVPKKIRSVIYRNILHHFVYLTENFRLIIKTKLIYICRPFLENNPENEGYAFMGRYGVSSYPFITSKKYKKKKIKILKDSINEHPFVIHNQKKLFFPKSFTENHIINIYNHLLIEQDELSPHRYVEDYGILKNRILLDIGSAEGIFALDTIQLTTHTYLFECDPVWVEALHLTFAPWKQKVSIIKKYVNNTNDTNSITIDEFIKEKEIENLFIKMDIEGYELKALQGAQNTLSKQINTLLAVCTYHKPNDPSEISSFLKNLGYTGKFNKQGRLFYDNRIIHQVLLKAYRQECPGY